MTEIQISEKNEQQTAAVRDRVPIAELPEFFARAFGETMAVIQAQGRHPVGPPFGKYYGSPTDVADVEAGFPVSAPIEPTGNVVSGVLPGGKVVETLHVGPFDTLERSYDEVERFFADSALTPGPVMWECYLSDPEAEPDPATWRTQIYWPVAETGGTASAP